MLNKFLGLYNERLIKLNFILGEYQGLELHPQYPPQGSESDVCGRRGFQAKKLTQVHYFCMFFIFCVRWAKVK